MLQKFRNSGIGNYTQSNPPSLYKILHMERSPYAHFQLKPFTSYRKRKVRACAHFKNIILLTLIIYFRPKSKIRLKEQVRHLLKHT